MALEIYRGPRGSTPPILPLAGVNAATPVIPKLYWDAYDDEQRIKKLWECFGRLVGLYNEMVPQVNQNTSDNADLQETLDKIEAGEYVDGYIDQLAAWIDANIQQLMARIVKYVFPGFYWDGKCWRLMMTVPTDWAFLKFSFEWVPEDFCYHVTLRFGDHAA